MEEQIKLEIASFCEECPSHENCPEDECVLFRIEKIILESEDKKNEINDKRIRRTNKKISYW